MLEGSLALLLCYVLQLKFLAFLFHYQTWFEKKVYSRRYNRRMYKYGENYALFAFDTTKIRRI